jgi:hypothetical protein
MRENADAPPHFRPPDTVEGCRERLATLQDEIASIRIQVATTDIRRQTEKKSLDPVWFHRAKTALRKKQREHAQLSAHLAELSAGSEASRRGRFKDALIEVLRDDCNEERWRDAVDRARALQRLREGRHG